jgi:methionyl-tRNA synthetase
VGKEIVRQHALYWPAFLMSAGIQTPRRIIAHGWWLMGGAKMSKSIGNVARYQDYAAVFGLDALRYFVMREMTLGQDANFSDEAILTRYNADLANDLGNVVSRTTTMIARYCEGVVPAADSGGDLDRALEADIQRTIDAARNGFARFELSVALQAIWDVLVRGVNQYIVKREPWKLAKKAEDRALLETTLYHSADALRVIAALVDPVMPEAAERIRRMLGVQQEPWTDLRANTLRAGTRLGTIEPLFPRIEKNVEELRAMTTEGEPKPIGGAGTASAPGATQAVGAGATPAEDNRISIDEFMKVELRVAKVLEAEAVPKSKKLVKLKVDVGNEQRTIVAGIAEAYQPEQLVGRTIAVVFNLKPAKLMGIESNGMVLAASVGDGRPILVSFDEPVPPGARVR